MQLPAYQPASLAAALAHGEEVFSYVMDKAKAQCPANVPRGPSSWTEVQEFVRERDEEKRKLKDKQKSSKSSAPFSPDSAEHHAPPGCNIGSTESRSAFWMFIEDYFRDLTRDDFKALMPCFMDPAADTDLTVPFLGREEMQPDERSKPSTSRGSFAVKDDFEEDGRRSNRLSRSPRPGGEDALGSMSSADAFGQPTSLSLSSCTDAELSALGALLAKLGMVEGNSFFSAPSQASDALGVATCPPLLPPLGTVSDEGLRDRVTMEALLSRIAGMSTGVSTAGEQSKARGSRTEGQAAGPAPSDRNIADGDHSEMGDFAHPMLRMVLARPPSAHVMDMRHCCSTLGADLDESDLQEGAQTAAAPKAQGKAGRKKKAPATPATGQQPSIPGDPFSFPTPLQPPQSPMLMPAQQQQQQTLDSSRMDTAGASPTPATSDGMLGLSLNPLEGTDAGCLPSSTAKDSAHSPMIGLDLSTGVRGRARLSVNYNMLAGNVKEKPLPPLPPSKTKVAKPPRPSALKHGAAPSPFPRSSFRISPGGVSEDSANNPVHAAVAALIAAAPQEGPFYEQWPILDKAADVLAVAPDDEILAEMLALQGELAQQVAINRRRAADVLLRAVEAIPAQQETAKKVAEVEEELKSYYHYKLERRRSIKREKREAERRQQVSLQQGSAADLAATPRGSGRPVGRPKKLENMELSLGEPGPSSPTEEVATPTNPSTRPLDPFAHRGDDEEAMCAVCGDGTSIAPNEIVFCERCDLAVHQHCYGMKELPDGEWLCWPCQEYEQQQRREGVPQNQIRPPRWEMAAKGITPAQLPGGTCEAECCLCPVKFGAFKKTVDTKQWVHLVCALWHPETAVRSGNVCEAVENVRNVRPEKFKGTCNVCRFVEAGAVLKCNYGHCQATFHPLCGRHQLQYIPAKIDTNGRLIFRAYCLQHSEQMREKDSLMGNIRGYVELATYPKLEEVISNYVRKGDAGKTDSKSGGSKDNGKPVREHRASAMAQAAAAVAAAVAEDEEEAAAAEDERACSLAFLAGKEEDDLKMTFIRFELEKVRLMVDQVRRREKLKRNLVKNLEDVVVLIASNPSAALAAKHHLGLGLVSDREHQYLSQDFNMDLGLAPPPPPPPLQPLMPPPPPPLTPMPLRLAHTGRGLEGMDADEMFALDLQPMLSSLASAGGAGGEPAGHASTRRGRSTSATVSPVAKFGKSVRGGVAAGARATAPPEPASPAVRGSDRGAAAGGLRVPKSMIVPEESPDDATTLNGRPKRKIQAPRPLAADLLPNNRSHASRTAAPPPVPSSSRSQRLAAKFATPGLDSPSGMLSPTPGHETEVDEDDGDFILPGATVRVSAKQRSTQGGSRATRRGRAAEGEEEDVPPDGGAGHHGRVASASGRGSSRRSEGTAPQGKKQRQVAAPVGTNGSGVGDAGPDAAASAAAGHHNTRHAVRVDCEVLMTPVEAGSTNTKLPKNYKYFKIDALLGCRPSGGGAPH